MPRLVCLQHIGIEGPGALVEWAHARGFDVWTVPLYAEAPTPALRDDDLLVVLGGPMSVGDDRRLGWLKREKAFLGEALEAGRRVVGICLGAQLIADALGARVRPNACKEIGWYEVTQQAPPFSGSRLPRAFDAYHWHSEAFELPDDATRLWSSDACDEQGFVWRDRALALQFHLEATPAQVDAMCACFPDDLAGTGRVQSRAEMLAEPARFASAYRVLATLMDEFVAHRAPAASVEAQTQLP